MDSQTLDKRTGCKKERKRIERRRPYQEEVEVAVLVEDLGTGARLHRRLHTTGAGRGFESVYAQ